VKTTPKGVQVTKTTERATRKQHISPYVLIKAPALEKDGATRTNLIDQWRSNQ